MASDRSPEIRIDSISPTAAIPGGAIEIRGAGFIGTDLRQPEVLFGDVLGRIVVTAPDRLVVNVPAEATASEFVITLDGACSRPMPFFMGEQIADSVHPVTSPTVDQHGNVYTTLSGARGKKTPVSVYRVEPGNRLIVVASDIVNATGVLVRPDGSLLVSSRQDGSVYMIAPNGEIEVFAEGMGVATGLAMDVEENLYVGDRTGTIFKISPSRKIYVFATLESSVAAYHMAMGPDGSLFVSAPTTSSYDPIRRIDRDGTVSVWKRGFGRPQGIAFDSRGSMYLCASYRGRRGIFRIGDGDAITPVVSGSGIVGLAFEPGGSIVAATGDSIFRFPNLN